MSRRPRVLLLTNWLAVGGAEAQLVRLAVHLRREGYAVMVATILPDGRERPELRAAGIRHEVLPLRPPVRAAAALVGAVRLFRRWRPDVVVSFLFHANVLARVAASIAGVPVVVSSVRSERFGGRSRDAVLRWTDRLARLTVANSHATARRLVADRIVRADRMRVIPNGVPIEAFLRPRDRAGMRRRLAVTDADFLWLALGRLEPVKDYATLVRAFVLVRAHGHPAHLRIAGEGSRAADLAALIDGLDLRDAAELLGLRDDVPALLAAADGLVLTSIWEGLPNVVIEAMAAGVPVVATDTGGTPELVRHGVTGLLVPPGDPRSVAAAMRDVMGRSAAERRTMGEAARRLVSERYALDRVMGEWEELLAGFDRDPTRVDRGSHALGARGGRPE